MIVEGEKPPLDTWSKEKRRVKLLMFQLKISWFDVRTRVCQSLTPFCCRRLRGSDPFDVTDGWIIQTLVCDGQLLFQPQPKVPLLSYYVFQFPRVCDTHLVGNQANVILTHLRLCVHCVRCVCMCVCVCSVQNLPLYHSTAAAHEHVINIYGNLVWKQGPCACDRCMHPCRVYLCVSGCVFCMRARCMHPDFCVLGNFGFDLLRCRQLLIFLLADAS